MFRVSREWAKTLYRDHIPLFPTKNQQVLVSRAFKEGLGGA